MHSSKALHEYGYVYAVAFRLNAESSDHLIYSVILNDTSSPLLLNGSIPIWTAVPPTDVVLMLVESAWGSQLNIAISEDKIMVCDVAASLYVLQSELLDPSSSIVQTINTLEDYCTALGVVFSPEEKRAIKGLCDPLTFGNDVELALASAGFGREYYIRLIQWMVGVLATCSFVQL